MINVNEGDTVHLTDQPTIPTVTRLHTPGLRWAVSALTSLMS